MIVSTVQGGNADLLPQALALYVPEGSKVADVTWGHGTFWRKVNAADYSLHFSDLHVEPENELSVFKADFRALPYKDGEMDALVFDPPYMGGTESGEASGKTMKWYRNNNATHADVIRLYAGGLLEAARVLRKHGRVLVKTQDEMYYKRQCFTHMEVIQLLELMGFRLLDLFVLVRHQAPRPHKTQISAWKNHSYLLVAELRN